MENELTVQIHNKSTKVLVITFSMLAIVGGVFHGIFEVMQGNNSTEDILARIGAYTIIPNYIITGIATIFLSLLILVWTIGFVAKKYGPIVFLLLSILFFFVGGGIATSFGLLITWLIATRINKPLTLWQKILPAKLRKHLSKMWLKAFLTSFISILIGLGVWLIFTPPGEMYQINIVDYICWAFLFIGLIFLVITIISGFALDIELQNT